MGFDGTASDDPDGTIVTYAWSVDDGGPTNLSGVTPTYDCSSSGTFTVTLTVTDDADATDQAATSVECSAPANTPPTANPGGPYSGTVGGPSVDFDGTASDDPDGTIVTYAWSVDDGGPTNLSGVTPTYDCSSSGTFTVTLTVTDDADATDQAATSVECSAPANTPPTANPGGPYSGTVGGPSVDFDGTASDDPDGTIVTYAWSVDDDGPTNLSGVTPTYDCPSPGTFAVTLTVTDDADATDQAATSVECAAAQPTNVSVDFAASDGGDLPRTVPAFSPFSYRVRVENTSEVLAEDVALTVTIDPDATGVSATDLEADGNVWSGTRPAIAPGEVWDVVFNLTVEGRNDSPHLSLAQISAPLDPDGEDSDNQARLRIRIVDEDA